MGPQNARADFFLFYVRGFFISQVTGLSQKLAVTVMVNATEAVSDQRQLQYEVPRQP